MSMTDQFCKKSSPTNAGNMTPPPCNRQYSSPADSDVTFKGADLALDFRIDSEKDFHSVASKVAGAGIVKTSNVATLAPSPSCISRKLDKLGE
jgi:hypothetical protein